MRRLGIVAFGLAGFLLCATVLLWTYAPGKVKKTPLGVTTTMKLEGTASVLPTGGSSPVKALSRTKSDDEKSDGDVVVFDTFTCLVKDPNGDTPDCVDDTDPERRLVTASTDRFATDRKTATAVNDTKYVGDAKPHEGVVNKLPFDVEKKTYPYWDGLLGRAVDLKFESVEALSGLETYKFRAVSTDEPAEIAPTVQGTYSSDKSIWVDPVTGSFIKQAEQQQRKTDNGQTVLDLDFGFTDATVAKNVAEAKDNGSRLGLLAKLPFILGALGLVLLVCGVVLARGQGDGQDGRNTGATNGDGGDDPYVPTHSIDVFGDGPADPGAEAHSRADMHRR